MKITPNSVCSIFDKGYRFGFNGKEKDNESGLQDYGMRIYNVSLGKFLSVDPLASEYPWNSVYSFAEGNPIWAIDLDGLEALIVTYNYNKDGKIISTKITSNWDLIKESELTVTYVHNYPDDPTKNKTDNPVKQFKTAREIKEAQKIITSMRDFIKLNPGITEANKNGFTINGVYTGISFSEDHEVKEPTKPVGTKKPKAKSTKSKEKAKEVEEEKSIFHPKYQSSFKKNDTELKEILEDAKKMTSTNPDFQFNPETDIEWGTQDINETNCNEKKNKKWKLKSVDEVKVKVKKEEKKKSG